MENQQEKIIVGLDIGTTKICVIVAKQISAQKIEVICRSTVESNGVEHGEVKNILETSKDIRKAVDLAEKKSGLKITKVMVGIAGAHIKSSVARLGITRPDPNSLINEKDISILRNQAENIANDPGEIIISCQPQEYFVDNQIPKNNCAIGYRGNRLEANWHIIKGNTKPAENIKMAVELAKLELYNMELEPIASAESVLTEEELREGVCIVDIGGGTTDLAIFYNGVIRHTAIIPYAGEYLTKMIKETLKLTERTSKKLKENRDYTSAVYKHIDKSRQIAIKNLTGQKPIAISQRDYCHLVNKVLEQIFHVIKGEILPYYYRNELQAGIVITGGGANIPNLKIMVEEYTGIPTQIGRPTNYISNLKDDVLKDTMYSTAVGLVLLAAKSSNESFVYSPPNPTDEPINRKLDKDEAPIVETKIESKTENWAIRLKNKVSSSSFGSFFIDENQVKDFED